MCEAHLGSCKLQILEWIIDGLPVSIDSIWLRACMVQEAAVRYLQSTGSQSPGRRDGVLRWQGYMSHCSVIAPVMLFRAHYQRSPEIEACATAPGGQAQ